MDAGRGFFRHALQRLDRPGQIAGVRRDERLQRALELDLFFILGRRQFGAGLDLRAPQREHGGVAAIVEDDVRRGVAPVEDAADIVPIIGEAFALHREHRRATRGDRSGGVVLGRKDVARSEEHTSELQSLMRISYAVFCLKKKKHTKTTKNTYTLAKNKSELENK